MYTATSLGFLARTISQTRGIRSSKALILVPISIYSLVFCEGLEIITDVSGAGPKHLDIKFNHVKDVPHHRHLMGYTVLHRLTDIDDMWKANGIRGGWDRTYRITGLKPYKNYSLRTTPYSFQAAGLIGPNIVAETKEDGKSFLRFYIQ